MLQVKIKFRLKILLTWALIIYELGLEINQSQ